MAEAIAAHPEPWRLMLMPADETPAVVREHVARGRAFALTQARALVGALVAGRPELKELDQDLAAHSLLAMGEHCARLLIEQPEDYPPERLVSYARGVLRAFGGPPRRLPGAG
jgi:hypothetical protein